LKQESLKFLSNSNLNNSQKEEDKQSSSISTQIEENGSEVLTESNS
jgi:hypothetical protein